MNEALVEDAENNVDGGESSDDEHHLICKGILKGLRGALKGGMDGRGNTEFVLGCLNMQDSGAERGARREIEG